MILFCRLKQDSRPYSVDVVGSFSMAWQAEWQDLLRCCGVLKKLGKNITVIQGSTFASRRGFKARKTSRLEDDAIKLETPRHETRLVFSLFLFEGHKVVCLTLKVIKGKGSSDNTEFNAKWNHTIGRKWGKTIFQFHFFYKISKNLFLWGVWLNIIN